MTASALRMPARARTSLVCLTAFVVSLPQLGFAQAAGAAPAGAAPTGVAGGWSGWAKLTNEWPGLACQYESAADAETVQLEISGDAGRLRGSLAIDIPAATGSGCPPLRKRYAIEDITEASGNVSFTDSGGNEWTLGLRRQGQVLQGLLAWRTGGPDEPLAAGFTSPNGQRPLARLSGEVRLRRSGEPGQAATAAAGSGAAAPAAKAKPHTSAGSYAKYGAAVLGANVVGLGLVYGVNKVGKGSAAGSTTCSPRLCQVGVPGQGCVCQPSLTSGVSCGETGAGVDLQGTCDGKTLPCRSGLSCDLLPNTTSYVCHEPTQYCP